MGIAPTLERYLNDQNVDYDVVTHERTNTSLRTARESHVPGDHLAKGVILTREGGFVMAVLPASQLACMPHVNLSKRFLLLSHLITKASSLLTFKIGLAQCRSRELILQRISKRIFAHMRLTVLTLKQDFE